MSSSTSIAIACDHAGFSMKQLVNDTLTQLGADVVDLGTHSAESVDYPDMAENLGRAIQDGSVQRGILLCGSGAGACIAANKLQGIRAAVCHDTYTAHQAVEHDDVNVLCLGSRVVGPAIAEEIITAWYGARFSTDERHRRRVGKIAALEAAR